MPRSRDHVSGELRCSHPDCPRSVKNHRWGITKASDWFFGKDGKQYCPDHIPDWVEAWRKRKKK